LLLFLLRIGEVERGAGEKPAPLFLCTVYLKYLTTLYIEYSQI